MEHLDVLFLLLGAIMILAMHAGFAFLEVGTTNYKNLIFTHTFVPKLMDSTFTLLSMLISHKNQLVNIHHTAGLRYTPVYTIHNVAFEPKKLDVSPA